MCRNFRQKVALIVVFLNHLLETLFCYNQIFFAIIRHILLVFRIAIITIFQEHGNLIAHKAVLVMLFLSRYSSSFLVLLIRIK